MIRKKRIEYILKLNFNDCYIVVEDVSKDHSGHNNFDGKNETHFVISLKLKKNFSKNRMYIHRKINNLLKNEFEKGLHSLQIKIKN